MTLPVVDHLLEVGFDGEADGAISCIHIAGHVDTDMAIALAWADLIEWDASWGHRLDAPRHCWTSMAPFIGDDGEEHETTWVAVYSQTERPGWDPVTVVDVDPAPYRPCAKCAWHAVQGFSLDYFTDPPTRGNDGRFLWFCDEHSRDISRRLDEARAAAYAEIDRQMGPAPEPAHPETDPEPSEVAVKAGDRVVRDGEELPGGLPAPRGVVRMVCDGRALVAWGMYDDWEDVSGLRVLSETDGGTDRG